MSRLGEHPWRTWSGYMLLVSALYALATRAPQRPPLVVEPSPLDALVPFVPAAAYAYMTYALLLPALIVLGARRRHFGSVFAAGIACGLVNALVYNLVPTRISERTVAPAGSLLEVIQRLDTTLGAIPSGHVALPAAVATAAAVIAVRRCCGDAAPFWRRTAAAYALWTAVLAASTLLTRQHYVLDVLAGVAFGPAVALLGLTAVRRVSKGGECGR